MGDYDWLGPAIQAGAGLIGSQQSIDGSEKQNKLLEDAYRRALAMLDSGQLGYTPERGAPQGPSAMAGVRADPGAVLAQQEAIRRLGEASRSGFDTIDRAAINRTMNESNANEKAQREAVLARMDPNSGAAMSARLSAQQSGANRANQQALDIAAMSRKRALSALGQFGNMSSQMRGQSFNEDATRANSMDAISKFNAELSQFNARQGNNAAQRGIENKLQGLRLSGGAGGDLGSGLANTGNLRAQQTKGVGNSLAGFANAQNSKTGTTSTTPTTTTTDPDFDLDLEDEEFLNENDDD
jgi:hypothetical protein